MIKLSKLLFFSILSFFCLGQKASAQVTDLSIEFTGTQPAEVLVGSAFAITGRVFHVDANSTDVPSGETVIATVELKDPDGQIISTHIQTWDGFTPATPNPELDNDNVTTARQVIFSIPWSQAQKWTETALWSVTIRVQGAALENNPTNNQATHTFSLVIPNLQVTSLNTQFSDYLPGSDIYPTVVVRNDSAVRTQEGVFFPLVVRLLENGTIVDEESVILPFASGGLTPVLEAESDTGEITMPPLRLPDNANPNSTWSVEAVVDPSFETIGHIIHETIEDGEGSDNRMEIPLFVDPGEVTLSVDQDSFYGDTGTFRGLDPVRISFSIRHTGTSLLTGEFTARVLLSGDDSFTDNEDFVLREFNVGQSGLGANLRPNETINLDWIQQLPDNLEGDYYLGVNIGGQYFSLENTPVITLTSEDRSSTYLVSDSQRASERPHVSNNGRMVVYEQPDENGNQQIYLQDLIAGGTPQLISRTIFARGGGGNGNSLRPRISSDGSIVIFQSKANDLVPGDENEHEDIFLFNTYNQQIIRAIGYLGAEPNEGSFYPDLNKDGTFAVFESDATNLNSDGSISSGRQIFLWDLTNPLDPEIKALTQGDKESRYPKIDDAGQFVVFESDATNLIDSTRVEDQDTNGLTDIFLLDLEKNEISRVNRPSENFAGIPDFSTNTQAMGGGSDQAEISGDGSTIVFRSKANNLITYRGISAIIVEGGGVGYFGRPSIFVTDIQEKGSGALLTLENGINAYGQIQPHGIGIINPGINYVEPEVFIVPDPNYPAPTQVAVAKALLTHPDGDIYMVKTEDVFLDQNNIPIQRISEKEGVGGNMPSREPSLSTNGQTIVYSTKSSNLLQESVTREDGEVFFSNVVEQALATATLVGGIGEIEVANSGLGYQNGFLKIEDFSGSGSGAIASYQVDTLGRISSISMVSNGENYNLESTTVSVENPRGGTGFESGEIRFVKEAGSVQNRSGGAKVHRVEMVTNGSGYQEVAGTSRGLNSLISIEGDGIDTDQDGYPDAKIDSSKIHIGENGGVFLEQVFDIEILSTTSLESTILSIGDATKMIAINFASNAPTASSTIGIAGKDLASIRDDLITIINQQWNRADITDIITGPVISGDAGGGTSFTFSALSGKFTTNNPSSLQITPRSNMLFSGNGFTRATPVVAPPPVIHGFSEVLSNTSTSPLANMRQVQKVEVDMQTDDIYLFDGDTGQTQRVSVNPFGFPVNYIASEVTTSPSNRFPAISGNSRHVFFSSDASQEAGLAFGVSNQDPMDMDAARDIYHVDRKISVESSSDIKVNLLFPNESLSHSFAPNATIPTVVQVEYDGSDLAGVLLFVDGSPISTLREFQANFFSYRFTGTSTTPGQGTHVYQAVAIDNAGRQMGTSQAVQVTVTPFQGSLPPTIGLNTLIFDAATSTSTLPLSITGTDSDGFIESVQYYVDGIPYREEIFVDLTNLQGNESFPSLLEFNSTGVKSIFAVAKDNTGNIVSSQVRTVSVSSGTNPQEISIKNGPKSVSIEAEINKGQITGFKNASFPLGKGYGFVSDPFIEIEGTGSGGDITFTIDKDPNSVDYGSIINGVIISGGSGYDSNTMITLTPVVRTIGFGTPAEISLTFADDNGTRVPSSISIDRNADQTLKTGSGYVVSPRLVIPPYSGFQGRPRIPLLEGTSGIDPSVFPFQNLDPLIEDAYLLGGFTQSSIYFDLDIPNVSQIRSVRLLVDGQEEDQKDEPPFTFTWTPNEAKTYVVYAIAQDFAGNVFITDTNQVKVENYSASGISASFNIEADLTAVPANSEIFLSSKAESEYGVAEVEYFLDGISLGKAFPQPKSDFFNLVADLSGFAQGPHELSMVAKDYNGNQAGSFPSSLTSLVSRQSLNLFIKSANPSSFVNSVKVLYPNPQDQFSSESNIPVFAQFLPVNDVYKTVYARLFLDGVEITSNDNLMDHFEFMDNTLPITKNAGDIVSNRFSFILDPSMFNETGNHFVQVIVYDANTSTQLAQSDVIDFEITPFQGSYSPTLDFSNLPVKAMTSKSSVPLALNAYDTDGILDSVQFYVNGDPLGSEIKRATGVNQNFQNYFVSFDPQQWINIPPMPSIYTFHATAKDKVSGNIIASPIQHLTITYGDQPPFAELTGNIKEQTFSSNDIIITLDSNGSVLALKPTVPLGGNYFATPRVDFRGSGTGAILEAVVDRDRASSSFGKVVGFTVLGGGAGYSNGGFEINLVPREHSVRYGTDATLLVWNEWLPQLGVYRPHHTVEKTFDGTPLAGEGYVIAPLFTPVVTIGDGIERRKMDRWPLTEAIGGTAKLQDLEFISNLQANPHPGGTLLGGFTRSPIYVGFDVEKGFEPIERVTLLIDGSQPPGNFNKTSPPFQFEWAPDVTKDYHISAMVEDTAGNVFISKPSTIAVEEYLNSGMIAAFDGEWNSTVEIGSQAMFSVQASSESGIGEVEFFLDGASIGVADSVVDSEYSKIVDFKNIAQGEHRLSFVATDKYGNKSGTHNPYITNLIQYKHKLITVTASSERQKPRIGLFDPDNPLDLNASFQFRHGEVARINLISRTDPDGHPERIYLFQGGRMLKTRTGENFVRFDPSNVYHRNNIFPFEFNATTEGDYEYRAMIVDSFGAQRFSDETIKVSVVKRDSKAPVIQFLDPNPAQEELLLTSTSRVRLNATAIDIDGRIRGVKFFVNGIPYEHNISTYPDPFEIPFDPSFRQEGFPYSVSWTPKEPGVYVVYALGADNSNNEVMSNQLIYSSTTGDQHIPNVQLSPLSSIYDLGDPIVISAGVSDLSSTGELGQIQDVRLIINGMEVANFTELPYSYSWLPSRSGMYEVYAIARDNEGNVNVSELSTVEIFEQQKVVLFQAQLPRSSSQTGETGLLSGSLQSINISADGDPVALGSLESVSLFANGKLIDTKTGTPIYLASNLIDKITYNFDWQVDYADYSNSDGTVVLVASGGDPVVASNSQTYKILQPEPWSNPVSAAGSILADLTGDGVSNQQIQMFEEILEETGGNTDDALSTWLGKITSSSLEHRIDIVASHHITLGYMHNSFSEIVEAQDFIIPSNEQWLKNYIDSLLNSAEYQSKFGQVPFLVGSYSQRNNINYFQNRINFGNQCLTNKYGIGPSYQQINQASTRMLNYWGSFEENYWEFPAGRPDDNFDSPPRRDALPVSDNNTTLGSGELTISPILSYAGPVAGHCAVDLIFNLSREYKFEGGFPYIASTSDLRNNFYKIAVYLYFLMRENISQLSTPELVSYLNLSFNEAFNLILKDYRYTSRFNLIWQKSISHGHDWKSEPWFGNFMDKYFPWIYHEHIGWMYVGGGVQAYDVELKTGGFWLYAETIGWFWTHDDAFPWVYLNDEKSWLYFDLDSSPRRYYLVNQNTWKVIK